MLARQILFHGLVFAAIVGTSAALAQPSEYAVIGKNALTFHEEIFREQGVEFDPIVVPEAVFDAYIFVELIGLQNTEQINALRLQIRRSRGLGNAAAVFFNGYRTIVYDPDWAKSRSSEFYLVLGHEAGHHFCGHTLETANSDRYSKELEADRFSGASIRRFEIYHDRSFFDEALAAAQSKYSEIGDLTHPPRALRIAAIKQGYWEGSPCGDLAPPIRGNAVGPR